MKRAFFKTMKRRNRGAPKRSPSDAWNEQQSAKYLQTLNNEDPPASVYLLLITPSGGKPYHKIGHTKQSIIERFRWTGIPSYITLAEAELTLSSAQQIEKVLLGAFKHKRYVPRDLFDGRFECFRLSASDIEWIGAAFKQLTLK